MSKKFFYLKGRWQEEWTEVSEEDYRETRLNMGQSSIPKSFSNNVMSGLITDKSMAVGVKIDPDIPSVNVKGASLNLMEFYRKDPIYKNNQSWQELALIYAAILEYIASSPRYRLNPEKVPAVILLTEPEEKL